MTTIHQEIAQIPEHEPQETDMNTPESSCESTKEIFGRDLSPSKNGTSSIESPKTSKTYTSKIPSRSAAKSAPTAKENTTNKVSNSGIPLRLKSGTNTNRSPKGGTYRHIPQNGSKIINKNTLEVQFINNKKRLLQLHSELIEKQRPLLDIHKSLIRTKKQLEELGKKVVLEEIKIVSLKGDEAKPQLDGAGENAEIAVNLRSSIDNVLDECVKVCKKCFVERDNVVKILENASKFVAEPTSLEAEIEEFKKENKELEQTIENLVKENEKKINETIATWQKIAKSANACEENNAKMAELEETIKQQQKAVQDAEDNVYSLTRKFEDKKGNYEKTINELQEKYNKLEDELKKEKKNANESLMKTRNMRTKMADLESKTKEVEEKYNETTHKLRQVQEQLHKKEVQWCKEKEEFKKNEQLLQQKFSEKQSQFDTRLKEMEKLNNNAEIQHQNFCRNLETQLEIRDQEFKTIETERDELAQKNKILEDHLAEMKKKMESKEKKIVQLIEKVESVPAIEYKPSESHWMELLDYKQKSEEAHRTLEQQNEQINKMQNSLKAHAKLAAALKMEKDNAIEYSSKLRNILQQARDELDMKNKTIYKMHEKLVIRERAYEKLRTQLKEYEELDIPGDKWTKNRCQICMTKLEEEKGENSSCPETDIGKSSLSSPQYVSESLIGMSVKKVDHLRARLDNLKKMNIPINSGKNRVNVRYTWSTESRPISNHLRKQIELRGKLYKILQKHADQSCEDFINLLKLTMSNGGKHDELKPSNMKDIDETLTNPRKFTDNLNLTESLSAFTQYLESLPKIENIESGNSDTDEFL